MLRVVFSKVYKRKLVRLLQYWSVGNAARKWTGEGGRGMDRLNLVVRSVGIRLLRVGGSGLIEV